MMEKNRIRENEMRNCANSYRHGQAKRRKQPERYAPFALKLIKNIV
jgi:hypothetical protein